MNPLQIQTFEHPDPAITSPIEAGIMAYGLEQVGDIAPEKVAFHAREKEQLIGGAVARIHFSQLFLDSFWVEESFRSQGVGSRILNVVETYARNQSCHRIQLNTLNPNAVRLYRRLGYETLAVIEAYIDGFDLHYMAKGLETTPSGATHESIHL